MPDARRKGAEAHASDSGHARWLEAMPVAGEELEDEAVPIPPEPPFITDLRNTEPGKLYVMPDSAEPVPPDILSRLDAQSVIDETRRGNQRHETDGTPGASLTLPTEARLFLEAGGAAAQKLRETLDRGLEATTPALEAAADSRLREAGLL